MSDISCVIVFELFCDVCDVEMLTSEECYKGINLISEGIIEDEDLLLVYLRFLRKIFSSSIAAEVYEIVGDILFSILSKHKNIESVVNSSIDLIAHMHSLLGDMNAYNASLTSNVSERFPTTLLLSVADANADDAFIVKRIVNCFVAVNSSVLSVDISKKTEVILEWLLGLLRNYYKANQDYNNHEFVSQLGIFPAAIELILSLITSVDDGGHGTSPLSIAVQDNCLNSIVAQATDILKVYRMFCMDSVFLYMYILDFNTIIL